jgi:hypothetical protein
MLQRQRLLLIDEGRFSKVEGFSYKNNTTQNVIT